jgi:hypothetical protein
VYILFALLIYIYIALHCIVITICQDLIFSGRIMMKHVTRVDEATVQFYRQQWSFVHPLVLSGRKLKKKKRKIEAMDTKATGGGDSKPSSVSGTSLSGTDTDTSAVSKVDDAKARYLKRKLEKGGK